MRGERMTGSSKLRHRAWVDPHSLSPAKSRRNAGRFAKGESGNPDGKKPGTPNRSTREIKAFCLALFERRSFQAVVRKWDNLTLDPAFRLLIMHYAFGKPGTAVQVGPRTTWRVYWPAISDLTNDPVVRPSNVGFACVSKRR
jgi:hypothetical protein